MIPSAPSLGHNRQDDRADRICGWPARTSTAQLLEVILKPLFDQSKLLILNSLKRVLKPALNTAVFIAPVANGIPVKLRHASKPYNSSATFSSLAASGSVVLEGLEN